MGGDLDATNIIKNTVLAVLVPISMDHQAFSWKYTCRDHAEKGRYHQTGLQCCDGRTEAGDDGSYPGGMPGKRSRSDRDRFKFCKSG